MIIIYPKTTDNKDLERKNNKNELSFENNTDFVFSSEKTVKQTLNFKFGSFKYHNPKCNDVIILENLEIEDSPRFFTRNSFDELWKLYIFLHDHPEISIKINGYPNEVAAYTPEECVTLTANATENVHKFLLYQNINEERIYFEAAKTKIENRKLPFYISQPFWIEIVITSIEKKEESFD